MKLDVRAMGYTGGAFWGLAVLFVGLVNLKSPDYGLAFLEMAASVYPGYAMDGTISSVMIGTGYAIVDGAIGGCVFAWLYNRVARG